MAATVNRSQRGRTSFLLDKFKRVFKTPKGVWKFRINKQNFHSCLLMNLNFFVFIHTSWDFVEEVPAAASLLGI